MKEVIFIVTNKTTTKIDMSRSGRETTWELVSAFAKTDFAIKTRKIIMTLGESIYLMKWGGDGIASPVPRTDLFLERIHDFHNVWYVGIVNVLRRAADKADFGLAISGRKGKDN